jgi:hypothetical protein
MKNYKIIENRAELSATQIADGMDFSAIKSKAAIASKTSAINWSAKTIILNSVAGAVLIGGTVFGIRQFNKEPEREKITVPLAQTQEPKATEQRKIDTTVEAKDIVAEKAIITPTKSPVNATSVNAGSATVDRVEKIKCTIVENYNPYNLHSKLNFPFGLECLGLGCELHYITYEELTAIPRSIKPVLLTIEAPKANLILRTNFAGVKLMRGAETFHPWAIGVGETDQKTKDFKYYSPKFKSAGATLKLPKKVDILVFFEDPKAGDNFVFGDISVIIANNVSFTNTLQLTGSSTGVASSEGVVSSTSSTPATSVTTVATAKESAFRQSDNATFTLIELTTNACYALKKDNVQTGITGMDCAMGCDFKYINCDGLSQIPYIRVARLTITAPKTKLVLKSNFENIKLIHGKTTSHPLAIYIGNSDPTTNEPTFLHEKFKSKGATLQVGNKVDIIMIIKEPIEAGDKLIFGDIRAILTEK